MGLFDLRFHQLAMYTDKPEFAVKKMQDLGYKEWIHDEATLTGEVHGKQFITRGLMWFNYEFYGAAASRAPDRREDGTLAISTRRPSELEFLQYRGFSWHEAAGRTIDEGKLPERKEPFLSHMSVYVKNVEKEVRKLESDYGLDVIQWFVTSEHLNKYLKDKRQSFYEFVFDTRLLFGYDIKLIQKIQH